VLKITAASYTWRYGGASVELSEVGNIAEDNELATIVANLTCAEYVSSDAFDSIILTKSLHLIYNTRLTIQTPYCILKLRGVLLATFPGLSQIGCRGCNPHWCWAFIQFLARRLSEDTFPTCNVEVKAHENVLAVISFLHRLPIEELNQEELSYHHPDYELLIILRAGKPVVTL
jgi:hypothetical protein